MPSLHSLADGCLGARPQGRTLAERPFGEGSRAVTRGLGLVRCSEASLRPMADGCLTARPVVGDGLGAMDEVRLLFNFS